MKRTTLVPALRAGMHPVRSAQALGARYFPIPNIQHNPIMENPPIESSPIIGWGPVIAWTCITGLAWACACISGYPAPVLLGLFMGPVQMGLLQRYGIIRRKAGIWGVILFIIWAMAAITFFISFLGAVDPGFIAAVVILFLLLHEVALKETIGSYSWGFYPLVSLGSAVLGFVGGMPLLWLISEPLHGDVVDFFAYFLIGCFHGAATGIAGFFLLKHRRQLPA